MAVIGQPEDGAESRLKREDSRTVSELMLRLEEKSREAGKLGKQVAELERRIAALSMAAVEREKEIKAKSAGGGAELELETLRARADEFGRKGNLLDAFHLYRRIIRMNPEDISALYRIAGIYYSAGLIGKAAQALRIILELDPDQKEASESLMELERGR